MKQETQLILLTTLGCTLCEKAKAELWPVLSEIKLALVEFDIIDSNAVMSLFATRIPAITLSRDLLNDTVLERLLDQQVASNIESSSSVPLIDWTSVPSSISDQFLCWPFSSEDIHHWLKTQVFTT